MTTSPHPPRTAAVIGAGIAGAVAARELADAGVHVTVIDKARGPGGRLATRRTDDATFDHGCPWIDPTDAPDGSDLLAHATPWNQDRWIGVPAMNTLVGARLDSPNISCRYRGTVTALTRSADSWRVLVTFPPKEAGAPPLSSDLGPFDAVVCTPPAPQTATLIADHDLHFASRADSATYQPCWTALIQTVNRIDLPTDVLRPSPPSIIELAIRNSAKPGRPESPPEAWVIHATPSWTTDSLELEKPEAAEQLRTAFLALCTAEGRPEPEITWIIGHRWRFAHALGPWDHNAPISNADGLAIAGDWVRGPGALNAARSGHAAAAALLAGASRPIG